MPLPTTTIQGPILLPSGAAPPSGYIRFVLSAFDTDNDITIPATSVRADIAGDGSFTIALWPNARGTRQTHYGVFLGVQDGTVNSREESIGAISVPESATAVKLEDLLGVPVPPGFKGTVILSLAAYEALTTIDPDILYLIQEA